MHMATRQSTPRFLLRFSYTSALTNPSLRVLWAIGLTTVARMLIVIGLLTSATLARPHPVRFIGALGTYVGGMALSVALLTAA